MRYSGSLAGEAGDPVIVDSMISFDDFMFYVDDALEGMISIVKEMGDESSESAAPDFRERIRLT